MASAPAAGTLGRVAAGTALASAVVHLLLLDASSLGSLVMLAMAAACLPCAWHLWRDPTGSVWGMTATLDIAMLGVHAEMLAGTAAHAHRAPEDGGVMWWGMAVLVAQLVLAGTAAVVLRVRTGSRRRSARRADPVGLRGNRDLCGRSA